MRRKTSSLLAAVCVSVALVMSLPAAAEQPTPTFEITSLGHPLSDVLVLGGTVAPGPDGSAAFWVATGGKPASLQAVNPLTGEVLESHPLINRDGGSAEGAYAVTAASNGDVYVGTYYDGRLYRRAAGANSTLEDLGQAVAGSQYIWRLAEVDGIIYGGTYSGGALFGFDPSTGLFRNYGQLIPGQMYVRSVAGGQGMVYAGTYDCHIIAVDPTTGERKELPQPATNCGHVQDLNFYDGRLYARTGNSIINATLHVWSVEAQSWVGSVNNMAGLDVSEPRDGALYGMQTDGSVGTLTRIDATTLAATPTSLKISGRVVNNRGMGWAELNQPGWPGATLVQMFWRGAIGLYNPDTGRTHVYQSKVAGEPIGIWSLATGESNVYIGGYLNGGLGVHDPITRQTRFNRFAQVESILEDGDKVWLGTYPDARKFMLDRSAVWHSPDYSPGPVGSTPNPLLVDDAKELAQVRTPAVTDLGDDVAFGTQGGTTLTGTLAIIDKRTRQVTTHQGPIDNQSTYSLTSAQGILYGGTSIYGGYAQPAPTTESGHLFAFDPSSGKLLWQVVPLPGQATVTGVTVTPDGTVLALANGQVTAHDRTTGAELKAWQLEPSRTAGSTRGDIVQDSAAGVVWVLVQQSRLYRIELATGEATLALERPMNRIALHPSGDLYIAANTELLKLSTVVEPGPETPTPTPSPSQSLSQSPSTTPTATASSTATRSGEPFPGPSARRTSSPTTPGLPKTGS